MGKLLVLTVLYVASVSGGIACPQHCWSATGCDKKGNCGACSGTWFGPKCDQPCPSTCWKKQCNMTGHCVGNKCYGPSWGSKCENPCPEHCSAAQCSKESGCCYGACADNYSGNCTCSIPLSCASPSGTDCSWYSTCLASRTSNCPDINMMMGKCQEYQQLESSLSPKGQQWAKGVRRCLMTKLAKTLIVSPTGQVACKTATKVFFGDHVGCYVDGPVSFCELPSWDIVRIMWQARGIFYTRHWWELLPTAVQLKEICDNRYWETVLSTRATTATKPQACNPGDLAQALNEAMAPYEWSAELYPATSETEGSLFYLLSGKNHASPVDDSLATPITLNVLASWLQNNSNCEATLNGRPVPSPVVVV